MREIMLRLAEDADVPRIMEIMSAARNAMADPSQYIADPEDYVARHISAEGFILLGQVDGVTAGFFMTVLPGFILGNTGYELNFPEAVLARTGVLDSVAVHPVFQGLGLMERMLRAAMDRLVERCDSLVATVSPDNERSLHNFMKCGFQPLREIVKPGGQRRYLMGWGACVDAAGSNCG